MILTADGVQTKVVIESVSRRTIEYKEWNDTTETVYSKPTAEVLLIRYQNGKQKVISPSIRKKSSNNTLRYKPAGSYMKYYGDAALGYSYFLRQRPSTNLNVNIQVETVHGIQINPNIFTGLGIGFIGHRPDAETDDEEEGIVSFYANARFYFLHRNNISFFLSSDIGYIKNIEAFYPRTRFYFTCGPGISVGRIVPISFSIRYQYAIQWIKGVQFRIGIGF